MKSLKIGGIEYDVSDKCVCQNIKTKETMTLNGHLTRDDINLIKDNKEIVKVYLNEFDEIVKLEFELDVWKLSEVEEKEKEYKTSEKQLKTLGFVTGVYRYQVENEIENDVRVLGVPNERSKSYSVDKVNYEIGDFVYLPSGETKNITAVDNDTKFDLYTAVVDYNYEIDRINNKIGKYFLNENSKIIEVSLQKDEKKNDKYSNCTLKEKSLNDLAEHTRYKTINLIVDDLDRVIRLYAVKEIGVSINMGLVKDIKVDVSGDVIQKTILHIINENKSMKKYHTIPVMGYEIGDLVTYSVTSKTEEEKEDGISINEVYRHEHIGNKYDLIINKYNNGRINFKNSNDIIDFNQQFFTIEGVTYDFDDYTFIKAKVTKNKETAEWEFTSFTVTNNKKQFNLNPNMRIAINEITGTIIAYEGYKE